MKKIVSRLAPTPSGLLHLGNVVNFVLTWQAVRRSNGTLILRIDDCDASRTRDEFIQDIFDTLEWLSIDYDLGPRTVKDFRKFYSQQLNQSEYFGYLEGHVEKYVCDCSRSQIQKASGVYQGTCRDLGKEFIPGNNTIRLRVEEQLISREMGDFVLWRRDNQAAYHLVSVVEDTKAGVNQLVRGEDLRSSSRAQRLLARKLGLRDYADISVTHHKLLTEVDGSKLSKSSKSLSIRELRKRGESPARVYERVGQFLGFQGACRIESFLPEIQD